MSSLEEEFSVKNEKPLTAFSKGSKQKVWWQCKTCNHEWESRIGHRYNGVGCPICGKRKSHRTRAAKHPISKTHPQLACEWADCRDINLVSFGSNEKINWKCQSCSKNFIAAPNCRTARGSGCPYCSGRVATEKNCLQTLRPDLAQELLGLDPLFICSNSGKKVTWKCKHCEYIWLSSPNNRFKGNGCPKCAIQNSKAQRKIANILEKVVQFVSEKRFSDCRDKLPLPFDFAIYRNDSLIGLIEYQGQHHFFAVWGQTAFYKTQQHDEIKINYCSTNKIPLLCINYWDFDKIETLLLDWLSTLS